MPVAPKNKEINVPIRTGAHSPLDRSTLKNQNGERAGGVAQAVECYFADIKP
jgi:hypothetical protein